MSKAKAAKEAAKVEEPVQITPEIENILGEITTCCDDIRSDYFPELAKKATKEDNSAIIKTYQSIVRDLNKQLNFFKP